MKFSFSDLGKRDVANLFILASILLGAISGFGIDGPIGVIWGVICGILISVGILTLLHGEPREVELTDADILKGETNSDLLNRQRSLTLAILKLAAALAKADGTVSETELNHIRNRLYNDFGPEKGERFFAELKTFTDVKIDLKKVCSSIKLNPIDGSQMHFLYFLIGIITSDGLLKKSELDLLKKIAILCKIRVTAILRILQLFEFKTEQRQQSQQHKKQSYSRQKSHSSSQLKKAYAVLGVNENTTFEAIKKAYRKLAKIHHPDKVSHLGEVYQKKAKEKFQLIVDAYDLIKEKNG